MASSGQLRWMAEESRDQNEAAVPPLGDRGQTEIEMLQIISVVKLTLGLCVLLFLKEKTVVNLSLYQQF